jgi:hypothetical protein
MCQSGKSYHQLEEGIKDEQGYDKSKMNKDMTMKEFNKDVADMSNNAWAWVSLYIAKAMHAFVKGNKKTIKNLYFFK